MQKTRACATILAATAILCLLPANLPAQGRFELIEGKAFEGAVPRDFYLEGNAIPTQKRNAALVKTPAGGRALFGLIDTTGYSSQITEKYAGMIITETALSICGQKVGVGSYGFGIQRPASGSEGDARFFIYSHAGTQLSACAARRDAELKQPRPLQVVPAKEGMARLYVGRHWVELR